MDYIAPGLAVSYATLAPVDKNVDACACSVSRCSCADESYTLPRHYGK